MVHRKVFNYCFNERCLTKYNNCVYNIYVHCLSFIHTIIHTKAVLFWKNICNLRGISCLKDTNFSQRLQTFSYVQLAKETHLHENTDKNNISTKFTISLCYIMGSLNTEATRFQVFLSNVC